jgi:lipid-A-disaccharide synthase
VTGATGGDVSHPSPSVLVVAGEASGDRIAARIAAALAKSGVRSFGMGGAACRAAGVDLVADLRQTTAMGLTEVMARLPAIAAAFAQLLAATRDAKPQAAVLVDYTEFNLRMGAFLRRRGVPVLWCVAPQVWAWRPRRMAQVARALDRLAVILPFEARLWQAQGVDAHYIGHPVMDIAPLDRPTARARLGLSSTRPSVAVLPGSRSHEVRRHLLPMLAALKELEEAGMAVEARLFVAASLDDRTRRWLAATAEQAGVQTFEADADAGAATWLGAFDAALTASGTATLECALSGAPPVVVYRLSPITAALARLVLRTPFVALPNIVLGAGAYPELLDRDVEPRRMARALAGVLEHPSTFEAPAQELRARLTWKAPPPRAGSAGPTGDTSADRAASLLATWLSVGSRRDACEPKGAARPDPRASAASVPP